MASALYNAPDGLTISELGEWLGHKDLRSTQHYAKIQPTRLAKSIARANKNSRLIQVMIDPASAAKGQPAIFYYLGASVKERSARIRPGRRAPTGWHA